VVHMVRSVLKLTTVDITAKRLRWVSRQSTHAISAPAAAAGPRLERAAGALLRRPLLLLRRRRLHCGRPAARRDKPCCRRR
jgi:hypothetical protein